MDKKFLIISVAIWLGMIGGGETLLLNYEKTPGGQANAPLSWPSEAAVKRSPDRMTLLVFVHPHCPCTRASMEELARLMARCQGKLDAHVILLKPSKFSENWTKTDLWKTANTIPEVKTTVDDEGNEARRFGALTSGQTLLYGMDGRLLFNGGITVSRGHSGDNAGRSIIESLVLSGKPGQNKTPVFGCPLSSFSTISTGEARRNLVFLKNGISRPLASK